MPSLAASPLKTEFALLLSNTGSIKEFTMTFYTASKNPRPIRLPETTRQFAYESLEEHRWGLDTMATPAIPLDDIAGIADMTLLARQDVAIHEIAAKAPIRLCPDERIAGAATLGLGISHVIPATLGGQPLHSSISHLTADFETVLRRGLNGIRADAEQAYETHKGTDREPFAKSCLAALDAFDIWHGRYMDALRTAIESAVPADAARLQKTLDNLTRVPYNPPETFHEAVQSLWFTFAFIRLMGNWPGLGRIDYLLGRCLDADLAAGRITLDDARDILAHFFIKGCEWVRGGNCGSGDAQHYQNILLAGIDENGDDVTCALTYLVLDILEELPIGDFPTTVRVSETTDEALLRRVAEVMRHGGGVLAIYNEPLVIRAMTNFGYPLKEARKFANDGCWEVQVPGKTYFTYSPFDSLWILQHRTLRAYADDVDFTDYDTLFAAYLVDLRAHIQTLCTSIARSSVPTKDWAWAPTMPCTVVSLFEEGCIEKGRSYLEGGPVYHVISPHIGGLADTVNALYAIKKLVFDDHRITFPELMAILRSDWADAEPLRQFALNRYRYYGNDNPECDAIAADVLDNFSAICHEFDDLCPYKFPAGVSTFGRQLEWAPHRLAAPHGHKKGEVLAANASPTPGSDREGVTAMIRSYCRADLSRQVTGAALDCKLLPSSVAGEDGLAALVAILRGFVTEGGFFLQPDVVDTAILHDAQEHPEDHQTLSVRVSGWNARFVTLCKQWQDMVIAQNEGQGQG